MQEYKLLEKPEKHQRGGQWYVPAGDNTYLTKDGDVSFPFPDVEMQWDTELEAYLAIRHYCVMHRADFRYQKELDELLQKKLEQSPDYVEPQVMDFSDDS